MIAPHLFLVFSIFYLYIPSSKVCYWILDDVFLEFYSLKKA